MRTATIAPIAPDAPALTVEQWAALPEDEPGELVDGRLVEDEVPDVIHEVVALWLARELDAWGDSRGALVVGPGAKYAVAPKRGRMPDLSVFLAGRRPPGRGVVHVPPDIAVEIVSTALSDVRRDRIEKLGDYAEFGIRWYWVVDPQLRTFEVWELSDGRYGRVGLESGEAARDIPGCDGLVLELGALWQKVAALEP